jgi:TetR/AcrR family transcriptional regulator, transcriptional repressor for nem operon
MTPASNPAVRERILEAAQRLFHASGLQGVSMDAVAAAAGLKKANLFHYYPTRAALELAVVEIAVQQMKEQLRAHFPAGGGDPAAKVAAMFDEAGQSMQESQCTGGCFIGNLALEASDRDEVLRQKIADLLEFWTSQLATFLAAARDRGALRPSFDPRGGAIALVALFEGALLCAKATRRPETLRNVRDAALVYLGGWAGAENEP